LGSTAGGSIDEGSAGGGRAGLGSSALGAGELGAAGGAVAPLSSGLPVVAQRVAESQLAAETGRGAELPVGSDVGLREVQRGVGSASSSAVQVQRLSSATDLAVSELPLAEVQAMPVAPVARSGATPQPGDGVGETPSSPATRELGATRELPVVMRLAAGAGPLVGGRSESTAAEPVVARSASAPLAGQSPFVSALGGPQYAEASTPPSPVAKAVPPDGSLQIQRKSLVESPASQPTAASGPAPAVGDQQVLAWSVEDRFHSGDAVVQRADEVRSVSLQEMFGGQQGVVQRDEAPSSGDTPAEAEAAAPTTSQPQPAPPPQAQPQQAQPQQGAKGMSAAEVEELAKRLYEPLSARLRAELWLDRERAGRTTDRRR